MSDTWAKNKKSLNKQALENSTAAKQSVNSMQQTLFAGMARLYQFEGRLAGVERALPINEWRYLGIKDLLKELVPGFTDEVLDRSIEAIQIREFLIQSDAQDKAESLIVADSEQAEDGFTALFSARFFDTEGQEIKEQRLVRARTQLGTNDTSEELEFVIANTPVGQSSSMNFEWNGKEFFAEVQVLGLRKPAPKQEEQQPASA